MAMDFHAFSVEDAKLYGVDAAILLQNLKYWLDCNKANRKHIHDNYVWSYNSSKAYAEIFPYWTANKIQKTMKKLENEGVIISGNYNEHSWDRTKWYTMPEFQLVSLSEKPSSNPLMSLSHLAECSISNINTNIIPKPKHSTFVERVFQDQLEKEIYPYSLIAMEYFKSWKEAGTTNLYDGSLKIEQWNECEQKLSQLCDNQVDVGEVLADVYRRYNCKSKESVSLPYLLFSGLDSDDLEKMLC